MKKGIPINQFVTEVYRQQEAKRDFIAETSELEMQSNGTSHLHLGGGVATAFDVNSIAHQQIANHLGIPKTYYDRLRDEQPGLLDQNVNTLFRAKPTQRMVRTLDGNARAFLSDRYRPLDNFDLLTHILPVISDMSLQVESSGLTERNLYLKVFSQTLMEDIKPGDTVRAGLIIRNSEVGMGALDISPMTERLVCTNGMVSTDYAKRRYHVGRGQGNEDEARELYRDETREAEDRAFWMKAVDTLRAVFSEDIFSLIVDRMREAADRKLEGNPVKVVEVTAKQFSLGQSQQDSILTYLIQGGDLSQWGLANAITRASQDEASYDTATDLEVVGGKIIELSPRDWKVISSAKA